MIKTILINIAILLGLFLLMEAAVRLLVPQIGPLGVDSSLIHSGRFGDTHGLARSATGSNYGVTTRTTPDGFIAYTTHRQDASPDKTGNNWLLLGDSVTMPIGVQSDSSFAGRMAHAVSDSVRVLNSALIGYSAFDYLNVAGNIIGLGEPLPDRVILFWCLNDVYGDRDVPGSDPDGLAGNGDAAPAGDPAVTGDDRRPKATAVNRPTVRRGQGAFMRFLNRNVYSYQWLMASVSDRGQSYYDYDRQFYSETDPGFAAALDRITIIRDMAEMNGIRFDLVMMPYEYQYRSGGFHTQDVLMDALQDKGILAYDARGAFEGVADITEMYMYGDGIHFSEQGHRLIWQWLRSEFLLPG
ncbi:MAG: hypothetical protein ACNA8K_13800 [Cyclonatronaceae bacterium]